MALRISENDVSIKAPVSMIILTLNEELNIEYCLRSIRDWSDDIHIVDSFSKDQTLTIARKYTRNIHEVGQEHWARIRNWALKNILLTYEWILFLDADERLTEELKKEIAVVLKTPRKENGFYIRRRFIFLGRWLKHGDLYDKVLRLFKRDRVRYIEFGDSEYAVVRGNVGTLDYDMIHEDKKGISRWRQKHAKIAKREALRILNKEKNSEPALSDREVEIEGRGRILIREKVWDKIPLLLRPFLLFIYSYFVKLGFLDGVEGLIYHRMWAFWYRLLVYFNVRKFGGK